jgi:hypothetical protein
MDLQELRRRARDVSEFADAASDEKLLGDCADANGAIDAFRDEVRGPILDPQLHFEVGIGATELRQGRHDDRGPQRYGAFDAQATGRYIAADCFAKDSTSAGSASSLTARA